MIELILFTDGSLHEPYAHVRDIWLNYYVRILTECAREVCTHNFLSHWRMAGIDRMLRRPSAARRRHSVGAP